jgi:hypothetical protein
MDKDAMIERFGKEAAEVPLAHEPIGLDELKEQGASAGEIESLKKAKVWEIWDKSSMCAYWLAEQWPKLLDKRQDPYGLDGFWPCPKPLFSTQTTDTLVPVPDYSLYQDQAEEIDKLTDRIAKLVAALKVVGIYDASQPAIGRMLTEGVDNTLIPVDNYLIFAEKGGLARAVEFLPIDMVIKTLNECYAAREQAKQVVYDVTGISDIIRGSSVASETATAQQIKSQYATLRLRRMQIDVAEFASEVLRIKGQLIADLYSPQNLIEMSGIMGTLDAQHAEAAVQLLKTEPSRNFRIDVASDSLVEMDETTEKQTRVEFLQSVGQFMERSLPVAQQVPEMAPLIGEMLLFGVRAFKGGRGMEAAFDDAMAKLKAPKQPQPQAPDPEQIKAESAMQLEQMRQQGEQGKVQASAQIEQFKAQNAQALEAERLAHATQMEQMRQAAETERLALAQQAETERAQYKANLDARTKLEIAEMHARVSEKPAVSVEMAGEERLHEVGEQVRQMADANMGAVTQAVEMLAAAVAQMNKPRRRVLERGPDGRAIGMVEVDDGGL